MCYDIESTDFEIELLKKTNDWCKLKETYLQQFKTSFRNLYKKVGKYRNEFKDSFFYTTDSQVRRIKNGYFDKANSRRETQCEEILKIIKINSNLSNIAITKIMRRKGFNISIATTRERVISLEQQGLISIEKVNINKKIITINDSV